VVSFKHAKADPAAKRSRTPAPHLKSQASIAGLSLSDYLIRELRSLSERPTLQELRQRVQNRQKVELQESPADALRAERGACS